jgi:hypothetical protein
MPEMPVGGLLEVEGIHDHLWQHGLMFFDAEEVWQGPAKFFPQPARIRINEGGSRRRQPERVKMVGPDDAGRMLTFILSLPNEFGQSLVITGWDSTVGERTRYHRPGGKTRR